jgi:hypothetical protein
VTVPALATLQSQLSSVFLSSAIPGTRVSYVGMLLNTNRLNYSSAFTSSYLATLDPTLSTNSSGGNEVDLTTGSGFYLSVALSNGTTS